MEASISLSEYVIRLVSLINTLLIILYSINYFDSHNEIQLNYESFHTSFICYLL